ncbi:MAG: hypothetical protein JST81_15330 [Bacteroidetes bacterium]|nr:hypothetical protein [Bacteroidota bacterium]
MKKISNNNSYSFIILAFILLLGSCSKEKAGNANPDDHYYISFKANGVQKEYSSNGVTFFGPQDTSGIYTGILGAYYDVVGSGEPQLSLILMSRNPCTDPAVYQDPDKAVTNAGVREPQVVITYLEQGNTDGYQSLGLFSDLTGQPGGYFEHAVADAKATITEVTSTYVKGNFSATTYKSTDVSQVVNLTEGKFYLPRQ